MKQCENRCMVSRVVCEFNWIQLFHQLEKVFCFVLKVTSLVSFITSNPIDVQFQYNTSFMTKASRVKTDFAFQLFSTLRKAEISSNVLAAMQTILIPSDRKNAFLGIEKKRFVMQLRMNMTKIW